jgi:Holliday junction resolvase
MTESKIESKIITALEALGCFVCRTQGRGTNGVPDLAVMYDTQFCWLENKTTHGRVSAHQVQFRKRAESHRIRVFTVRSVEEAVTKVSEWFGISL